MTNFSENGGWTPEDGVVEQQAREREWRRDVVADAAEFVVLDTLRRRGPLMVSGVLSDWFRGEWEDTDPDVAAVAQSLDALFPPTRAGAIEAIAWFSQLVGKWAEEAAKQRTA